MTRLVPADPASLSAAAGTLRRVGAALRHDAEATRAAYRVLLADEPVPLARRRAATTLTDAVAVIASESVAVAEALQDQATLVAELAARARRLGEQIEAADCVLDAGVVRVRFGITGAAQAERERERATSVAELQREVDVVRGLSRRHRDRLVTLVEASTTRLAEVGAGLRA